MKCMHYTCLLQSVSCFDFIMLCFFSFLFLFSGILGNDSLWFPFPNCGNGFFSFPSRSRILGIDFFIPFPFPNFGNGFFSFPSRSRILGMHFFQSLPVPAFREWNYPFPFPFPNSQMSFPLTSGDCQENRQTEIKKKKNESISLNPEGKETNFDHKFWDKMQ